MILDSQKKPYIYVTLSYWVFMLTDGALRMLVLLHFYKTGFSPIQISTLFVFYELAGVFTYFLTGLLARKFGLATTLYAGFAVQILALFYLMSSGGTHADTAYLLSVMFAQGASGVAKDLVKVSAKSSVKVFSSEEPGQLFWWVALLTGSKNAIKGVGFFLGAVSLVFFDFTTVIFFMIILLIVAVILTFKIVFKSLPGPEKGIVPHKIFSTNSSINNLSLARVFLFGARDVWFAVALPIFLYSSITNATTLTGNSIFFFVGSFMSIWIIFYGIFQTISPRFFPKHNGLSLRLVNLAVRWNLASVIPPLTLSGFLYYYPPDTYLVVTILVGGLFVFGFIFAVNSSLHSYLVLALSSKERISLDVGFYYMANSGGRLIGTLLSGVIYQTGGLSLCLLGTAVMLLISSMTITRLKQNYIVES